MMQLHVIIITILFIITILIPRKYAVDITDVSLNYGSNLGQCQGNCDNDDACQGNLICYQTHGPDAIPPGCSGTPNNLFSHGFETWDYCQPQYINIGYNPSGSLGVCEGDCDNDSQCEGDLICYQRNFNEPGPYECSGTPNENWDYCSHEQVLREVDRTTHLGICEGDCDNDDQCAGDLKCFHRTSPRNPISPPVPGCHGMPLLLFTNYCYLPTYINVAIDASILGICEGDCDYDDLCEGDLICYQRSAGDRGPPGCSGIPNEEWDYCVEPGIITDLGIHVNHLGLCQGDCDTDADCNGDLKCYHQPGNFDIPYSSPNLQSNIPGCSGYTTDTWDYCYAPTYINKGVDPTVTLGLCEGDCDNDDQCSGDLKCYQRTGSEPGPPECFGTPDDYFDYCYMPEIHNVGLNPTVSLRLCEGDCDNDDQCAGDLKCYQRTGSEPGPHECKGTLFIDWDYCYENAAVGPKIYHNDEFMDDIQNKKKNYFVITISQNSMYILIILVLVVVVILVGVNMTYLCMKSKNKQKGYASVKLFTDSEYDTESPIMQ